MRSRRTLCRLMVLALALSLMLLYPVYGEDRVILTIGDSTSRSGSRYSADLGLWQYVAERAGVEIRYSYLSQEEFASALSSGDLPDLVATQNNLSTIRENGVALNVDPYLE